MFISYNKTMLSIVIGILIRIISNSCSNVFQKILTQSGEKSSIVNFYTYLGLTLLTVPLIKPFCISEELLINVLLMGFLGATGNYCIIKALSLGELSTLAPINSYKPIIAMLIAFFYLGEIPSACSILATVLIIVGTYFVFQAGDIIPTQNKKTKNLFYTRSIIYRILALIFSGAEAVFIKKIILTAGVSNTLFLWALSGFIFTSLFIFVSKYKPTLPSNKYQFYLILAVWIMQYSTNYVFSKINVAYALAFFQLSTLLSVFLGVNIFGEKNFKQKIIGASIMLAGAIILQQSV